jgi:hypothetical protein
MTKRKAAPGQNGTTAEKVISETGEKTREEERREYAWKIVRNAFREIQAPLTRKIYAAE